MQRSLFSANKLSGSEKISEKSNVPDDSVKVSGLGLENQLSVNVPTSFLVDVSDAGQLTYFICSISSFKYYSVLKGNRA